MFFVIEIDYDLFFDIHLRKTQFCYNSDWFQTEFEN